MTDKEKFNNILKAAQQLGWEVVINEIKESTIKEAKFMTTLKNGCKLSLYFEYCDDYEFIHKSDGKLIYYKCMALRAKKFKETINGFSSNYNGQTFHTMDEFCDFLEDNKMTFRLDYSNYYFLKVDGVGDAYLKRFIFPDGVYSNSEQSAKMIDKVIQYLIKFKDTQFANLYLYRNKEEKQLLKNIYNYPEEIYEKLNILFKEVDEIKFA